MYLKRIVPGLLLLLIVEIHLIASVPIPGSDVTVKGDDPDLDPFIVKEEGCPVVSERNRLSLRKLQGKWIIPFSSLNWLLDIGMSLYNHSVKMSQITSICPQIVFNETTVPNTNGTACWAIKFICPKLKGEFELWCFRLNIKTRSKYICYNDNEKRDMYLMVAATNFVDWIVLIRCSPTEDGKPSAGMSWALLTKNVNIGDDVKEILFGLLEGYGFDVPEFSVQLLYDSCPS